MDHDAAMTGLMVIVSGVVAYTITATQLLQDYPEDVTNNMNKAYHAVTMALMMGAIMALIVIILGSRHGVSGWWLLALVVFLVLYLIVSSLWIDQVGVTDNDFVRGMIEHHAHALAMSQPIYDRTSDPEIKRLTQNIIRSQTDEIEQMKRYLRLHREY